MYSNTTNLNFQNAIIWKISFVIIKNEINLFCARQLNLFQILKSTLL
jgi:hypothetical protein